MRFGWNKGHSPAAGATLQPVDFVRETISIFESVENSFYYCLEVGLKVISILSVAPGCLGGYIEGRKVKI